MFFSLGSSPCLNPLLAMHPLSFTNRVSSLPSSPSPSQFLPLIPIQHSPHSSSNFFTITLSHFLATSLLIQLCSCPLSQGQVNHSHSLGPHKVCLLLKLLTQQLFMQKLTSHIQENWYICTCIHVCILVGIVQHLRLISIFK